MKKLKEDNQLMLGIIENLVVDVITILAVCYYILNVIVGQLIKGIGRATVKVYSNVKPLLYAFIGQLIKGVSRTAVKVFSI